MKNAAAILSTSTSVKFRPEPPTDLAFEVVDHVFNEFVRMLGEGELGRMFGDTPVEEVKLTWAEQLQGFTKREILRGLADVATRRFAPRLGEFTTACRPCQDPDAAWYEAEACLRQRAEGHAGDWTHPAVWRAAAAMSSEVQSGDLPRYRGRWTARLKRELAQGMGDGFPTPPPESLGYTPPKSVSAPAEAYSLSALMREEQRHKKERAAAKKAQATTQPSSKK